MTQRPVVLLTDDGQLTDTWPFVRERFERRLAEVFEVHYADVRERSLADRELADVQAIAWFGGELTTDVVAQAPNLRMVGGIVDGLRPPAWPELAARGIPFVDVTRAWAPSVAECALALALGALRRIPQHHRELAEGRETWLGVQFTDDPAFVNGDLGTKQVGVVGMGQIGGRIAGWCTALGSSVQGYDPYAPAERFATTGARRVDLDDLCAAAEVLFVAVPPTPSAIGMIDADLVASLAPGTIVVTISRAAAIDCDALRRRVLDGSLAWAADVFDVEPLPPDDPLRGRANVVHVPHIAGRTRDTNHRVADLLAEDVLAVFAGREPACVLTESAATLRAGVA
jgi:phosphoglycerate dehydrogenase-like enzyme